MMNYKAELEERNVIMVRVSLGSDYDKDKIEYVSKLLADANFTYVGENAVFGGFTYKVKNTEFNVEGFKIVTRDSNIKKIVIMIPDNVGNS